MPSQSSFNLAGKWKVSYIAPTGIPPYELTFHEVHNTDPMRMGSMRPHPHPTNGALMYTRRWSILARRAAQVGHFNHSRWYP